ncbi:MAG: DUF2239 family protein [Alphaproteobacteria bacterium]|nr:DUF2239 family protein [Alphaproteobacteria bacterium]
MDDPVLKACIAFDGARRIASGSLEEVALAVKRVSEAGARGPVLAFDAATGRVIDFDLRGTPEQVIGRLRQAAAPVPEARGPGRPKLGVVAREVTLLPRHWEWLNAQPGGASVTLRKLVEAARRDGTADLRAAQEAAYRFMSAMAGDNPGFEEASRALFARDRARFVALVADWPIDVRVQATKMAFGGAIS